MSAVFLFLLVCSFVAMIVFRRLLRRLIKRAVHTNPSDRCVCGYSLKELDLARCPECGRVISFNVTPEDLGLSSDELAKIQRKRRERSEPTAGSG